jgi:hypothetical protein
MAHLAHGPFLVAEDGALTPLRQPALRFAWRGRGCAVTFDAAGIKLAAQAGAVPYTAERPAVRPGAFAALGALPAALPAGWRMRLLPDHRVLLETTVPLRGEPTATALVSAMVGFALALDPYLDRLESAGVAAGTVKT